MALRSSAELVAAARRAEQEKLTEQRRRRLADTLANQEVDFQDRDDYASAEELNAAVMQQGDAELAAELAAAARKVAQEERLKRRRRA